MHWVCTHDLGQDSLYRPPMALIRTQYFHLQLSDPVYNSLFELYCQSGRGGQLFVLQFVPVLIWTYLSATTRRDELVKIKAF